MNVGTIGTGAITSWFLTCWQELGNSCVAIYSRTYQSGEALRKQFHGDKVYTDLDVFMADEKIEVVYIASPNSLHFSHAKKALCANKHVILEKPFTSTIEECEELIQLAKEKNLMLMEGITVVDLPNIKKIATLIKEIEPIHFVVSNMSKVSSKYHAYLKGEKPNVFQTAYSGGALMDLNVYNLYFMTTLFGIPQDIHYIANKIDGIDMSGVATLRYEDKLALCIAAKDSDAHNFVELQGEHGILRVHSASATCSSFELTTKEGVETYALQGHELTHIYYIKEFIKMVENCDVVQRDRRLHHTYEVMKLLVQARKCANIIFEADV